MRPGEWTLRSRRVVTPGGIVAADILIRGETIGALADHEGPLREGVILDVGSRAVMPGLVDLGARVRGAGPGLADDFEAVTRSAASGGFTTVVDLPVPDRPGSPGPRAFEARLAASAGRVHVDCGFLGLLVPGSVGKLARLVEAGVLGFVGVLGRPAGDVPALTLGDLREALPILARLGRPLLILGGPRDADPPSRVAPLIPSTVPEAGGSAAFPGLIELARTSGCRVHLVGPVEPDWLSMIEAARAEGPLPMTVGNAPEIPPPRSLPDAWAEARSRGLGLDDLARGMAEAPARVVGLGGRKGAIVPGAEADLVVFDPGDGPPAAPARPGRVIATVLRGQIIHEEGREPRRPQGTAILRVDETMAGPSDLDRLNNQAQAEALELLRSCCGSSRWAWRLLALRPFRSIDDLLDDANRVWSSLGRADRIEAFEGHPRFSERISSPPGAAMSPGPEAEVGAKLARADRDYEAKFAHRFVLSDPDRPPAELLDLIRRRLANDPDREFLLASDEQAEITRRHIRGLLVRP